MRRLLTLAMLGVLASCEVRTLPPLGHVLLYIDTDAPLPSAPGATRSQDAPAPLFDRVLVDIFRPGEVDRCAQCSREIDLDEELVRNGASFAVLGGPGLVARVRLVRSTSIVDGAISPFSTVEVWVAIPAAPSEGRGEATITLATEDVGVARGTVDEPIATAPGRSASPVGSWPDAQRIPCSGEPLPDEVCVPGGAYWMGNPHNRVASRAAGDIERLVVIAPFYMQDHEITVAELRARLPNRAVA